MNKNQQLYAVAAICLSIIMAGVIIVYRPGAEPFPQTTGSSFRYPSGVGTSLGFEAITYEGGEADAKTISISGSGRASATANEAVINLGVQTEDKTASEAIEENAADMTAVIEAIKKLGFTEDDFQTTSYTVYPNYNWELRTVTGYTVRNMIQISIDDLDQVGPVIDAAGAAGANQINGINFALSNEIAEEVKLNAHVAAIEDAERKAEVIAETLGLTIIGVQSVSVSSYSPARSYAVLDGAEMAIAAAPTPIVEGDLTINVTIHIVYLID